METNDHVGLWGAVTCSIAADHWLISGVFLLLAFSYAWRKRTTGATHDRP